MGTERKEFDSFDYPGIPYPTQTTKELESLGYRSWPYDPTRLSPPSVPNPWNDNVKGFYYVAPGGDNPENGFPDDPRGELPRDVSPGDLIVVSGKLIIQKQLNRTWNGSPEAPVFLVGEKGREDDGISLVAGPVRLLGRHLIIDGLTFDNAAASPSEGVLYLKGSFQTLRNTTVKDDKGFRKGFSALTTTGLDHTMFFNNRIGPAGNWQEGAKGDNDFHGIKVFGSDHWIVNNNFLQVQGDGVQISNEGGRANPESARRIFAGGNNCTQIHQTCLWTKDATDVIFSHNTAQDLFEGNNAASNGAFGGQGDYRNLWIIFNKSVNNGEGVKLAGTDTGASDAFVIGNVITDQNPHNKPSKAGYENCAITTRNGGKTFIVNNTIYKALAGICTLGTDNFVYGNFVDKPPLLNHLLTNREVDSNYNCFRGKAKLSGAFTGRKDLQGACDGFYDEKHRDFRLLKHSPLVDKVPMDIVKPIYDKFFSRYGLDILYDFHGHKRPINNYVDIGAFENE